MKSLVVLLALAVVAIAAPQDYEGEEYFEQIKKRSVGYGFVVPSAQLAYSSVVAPATVYAPHTLVKSAVVSPVLSSPVYVGGSAVSHQSRVDVNSSPAVVSEQIVQPVVASQTLVQSPALIESSPALIDTRSAVISPYYSHYPGVVDVHSPTFVTGDLLIKKKRDIRSA